MCSCSCLFPYYCHLAICCQLDNARRGMRLVFLPSCPADVVYGIDNLLADVAEVLCRRLTADIGARAHNGFLISVAEFLGEWLLSYTHGYGTIVGNEIWCQVDSVVEDYRCWFY